MQLDTDMILRHHKPTVHMTTKRIYCTCGWSWQDHVDKYRTDVSFGLAHEWVRHYREQLVLMMALEDQLTTKYEEEEA